MQESVEDEGNWGESSVALEEMGVTVLAGPRVKIATEIG